MKCDTPLVLDFREPDKPIRMENMLACPQPWLDRAQALHIVAVGLIQAGRGSEAVKAAREGIQLYRELIGASGVDVSKIASNLLSLSIQLSYTAGLHSEGAKTVQAAVEILRRVQPAHASLFASILYHLAVYWQTDGYVQDAIPPAKEAVQVYRKLVKEDPDHFGPFLQQAEQLVTSLTKS